jgi:hypothetical protein
LRQIPANGANYRNAGVICGPQLINMGGAKVLTVLA